MKKIILTLGIFLSAYATYAVNSNEKLVVNTNNDLVEDTCYRIIDHYDNQGNWTGVTVEFC